MNEHKNSRLHNRDGRYTRGTTLITGNKKSGTQAFAFWITAAPASLTYCSAGSSGAALLSQCRGTSHLVVPSLSADPGFFPIFALTLVYDCL